MEAIVHRVQDPPRERKATAVATASRLPRLGHIVMPPGHDPPTHHVHHPDRKDRCEDHRCRCLVDIHEGLRTLAQKVAD